MRSWTNLVAGGVAWLLLAVPAIAQDDEISAEPDAGSVPDPVADDETIDFDELEDLDINTDHTDEDEDIFVPTDEVSYQQSVPFPTDI